MQNESHGNTLINSLPAGSGWVPIEDNGEEITYHNEIQDDWITVLLEDGYKNEQEDKREFTTDRLEYCSE